jgi:hypothetical protein
MSSQGPGKRSFFKYAPPDTILAILRNQTIRYSSPLSFNDPFDFQSGLHFEFDLDSLHGKVLDRLFELAVAPNEPDVDKADPWGKLVLLIRQHYPTHGFPRGRWEQESSDQFAWLISEIRATQKRYQEHWWKTLLPGIRVFSVSEERDNLLMWAHYAKDHTGAVLEFLSLPDEDNPLSVAQPVQYVDHPPPFFTEAEWIDDILSIQKFDINELYRRYAYYKSRKWRYEKEWRVWYPLIPSPATLFNDMPIRQSEFASLYLGCKATDSFAYEAASLARKAFPSVRIFRARKSKHAYALEYAEI